MAAAREYTDELEGFTSDEKTKLNDSFTELTSNSAATPLAARWVQKFVQKAGPVLGSAILEIAKNLATAEAKKYLGS